MHMHVGTEVGPYMGDNTLIRVYEVTYLRSIMHMHLYFYVIGGNAYLLDRGKEWCHSESGSSNLLVSLNLTFT